LSYTQRWVRTTSRRGYPLITGIPKAAADSAVLIVFGGVPGSGKCAVSERVRATLGVPVFALDWLLGALTPFGMRHHRDLRGIGNELLTTLAY
jgi:hypothetical protein